MKPLVAFLLFAAACAAPLATPAPGTVNGCAPADFVAAPAGTVTVQYGDPFGLVYSPKCVSVAAGQTVRFDGDPAHGSTFAVHPLRAGGALGTDPGASGNPIAAQNSGTTYSVAFNATGTYGYFCLAHDSMGMYGAVQVR